MGKLAEYYTKVDKKVELKLPTSGDVMIWHRPSEAEIKEIMKYGETLNLDDLDSGVQLTAFILKMLCEKPSLAEESQGDIEIDLRRMEAPDRGAILPFFNELLGIQREEMDRVMADRFIRRTRK